MRLKSHVQLSLRGAESHISHRLNPTGVNLVRGDRNPMQTTFSGFSFLATLVALIYTTKLALKNLSELTASSKSE
ncbi:hypothetical protein IQ238_01995 [Pleurocapsales cyanobacterium LEGE 06147]|nr:hypothetical protein [Pleurocapsales cyanobacterium LEGE 06147]